MPIDAGDVVVTFLGDTQELDKAFDKTADKIKNSKEQLGPVGDAVGGIGEKWKTVGTAAEGAGASSTAATGQMASGAASTAASVGQVESAATGAASAIGSVGKAAALTADELAVAQSVGLGTAGAMSQVEVATTQFIGALSGIPTRAGLAANALAQTQASALATVGSLSQISTIAAVVGEVIGTAFTAATVFLFVEALFTGIHALEDLEGKAKAVSAAWDAVDKVQKQVFEKLEDHLLKSQMETAELTNNHLEALRLKLILIDHASLSELEREIERIAAAADKVFKDVESNTWIQRAFGFNATDEVKVKFHEINKEIEDALSPRTPEAFARALEIANQHIAETQAKMNDLARKDKPVTVGGFTSPGVDPDALKAYDAMHVELEKITQSIRTAQLAEKEDQGNAARKERIKDLKEAEKSGKDYTTEAIAEAKRSEQAEVASIQEVQAKRVKAAADGKLSAGDLAVAEVRAANDARLAHEKYLQEVVDIYAKAGNAAKAHAALEDLNTQKIKDAAAATKELAALKVKQAQADAALATVESQIWAITQKETKEQIDNFKQLMTVDPFTPQIKKTIDLNNALKAVGVQGLLPLTLHLNAAKQAEKLLNDAGIKEGKIWLEVQEAKLKAIIALDDKEGKSSKATIKELQDVERQLKKTGTTAQHEMLDFQKFSKETLQGIGDALSSALAAWLSGQESFGAALEKALGQYLVQVGSKAAIDSLYWAAWGIADSFWNPPRAGADFAAAAEFAAIAAIAGGAGAALSRGGNSNNSSGGGSEGFATTGGDNKSPATQAQPAPTGGQNVPHLAAGALVTAPTLAVVGDSRGGGSSREAVIPLDNADAMQAIAAAIGNQGGGNTYINVGGMISDDKMVKVISKMNRLVSKRQGRLTAGNSFRVTRRG